MLTHNTKPQATILDPWEAYTSPKERIPIVEAEGRIAASTIRQYPPGNPEIIPGMKYSDVIISRLQDAADSGADVVGVNFEAGGLVDVLVETTTTSQLGKFESLSLSAQDISPPLRDEISDFFRTGFSGAPYFHFAFHEDNPLQSLPRTLDFGAWQSSLKIHNTEARNTVQTQLLRDAHIRRDEISDLQHTCAEPLPHGFHLWTDPQQCRRLIGARLRDPGYVTLIREKTSGELVGLLHARKGTLSHIFETEEWNDPFLFSQYETLAHRADPDEFFRKMRFHFSLSPQDDIMTISAQLLSPVAQGGDIFYEMMRSMALKVTPEHASLPLLCEIPPSGTAHILNTTFTDRLIFGALENGHPLVFSQKTSDALFPFCTDKSHWSHALRTTMRAEKHYKETGFIPSTSDHAHVEVRENGDMGLAVFATQDIQAGSRIAIFEGETYEAPHALAIPAKMRDHAIQVAYEKYVFGHRGLAHCLCHSCHPNCGIRNLTEIFAARDILKGEQVTWDYRCSENSTWVLDACLCGSERCSKVVKNYDSLPIETKESYKDRGMISEWILSATES